MSFLQRGVLGVFSVCFVGFILLHLAVSAVFSAVAGWLWIAKLVGF